MKQTKDEVEVVVSDVFSSGLESPKVKGPLEGLPSVLDDPVPNILPLFTPDIKPKLAAGCSDFLSSVEAAPNLKPSDGLPNLNPALVSLEGVSEEVLPNGTPNLNPPDDGNDTETDSDDEDPNLNPPVAGELSDVPNLKPPVVEVEEPKVEEPAVPTDDEPKALGSTLAPGLVA